MRPLRLTQLFYVRRLNAANSYYGLTFKLKISSQVKFFSGGLEQRCDPCCISRQLSKWFFL